MIETYEIEKLGDWGWERDLIDFASLKEAQPHYRRACKLWPENQYRIVRVQYRRDVVEGGSHE